MGCRNPPATWPKEDVVRLALAGLVTMEPQKAASILSMLVEAVVEANVESMRRQKFPRLFDSGVRYRSEDVWRDAPSLVNAGCGDCKSLVSYRLAELRAAGLMAMVHVTFRDLHGTSEFHLQVRLPTGEIEDPSRILGMP